MLHHPSDCHFWEEKIWKMLTFFSRPPTLKLEAKSFLLFVSTVLAFTFVFSIEVRLLRTNHLSQLLLNLLIMFLTKRKNLYLPSFQVRLFIFDSQIRQNEVIATRISTSLPRKSSCYYIKKNSVYLLLSQANF